MSSSFCECSPRFSLFLYVVRLRGKLDTGMDHYRYSRFYSEEVFHGDSSYLSLFINCC